MEILFGIVGQLTWWWYVVIMLILTHVTIASVTLYLHRSKTHGSVEFSPVVSHFFRFWLWLTTGMKTHEWVAVHRKHHATCETEEDPHSPVYYPIWDLFIHGIGIYRKALRQEGIFAYVQGELSRDLPADWLEVQVYSKYPWLGLVLLGIVMTVIFGLPGLLIFAIQAYWIPGMAMGVINGFGHYWGYRNFATPDESRNIFPWGILIGGEELHNNHHAYQRSPRLSVKWWECDIGWLYIRGLEALGLAEVSREYMNSEPITKPDLPCLEREEFKKLFLRHSYFIGQKFSQVYKITANEETLNRVNLFDHWLNHPEEITAFELEKWIGEVLVYDRGELPEFANWLRNLHEADET